MNFFKMISYIFFISIVITNGYLILKRIYLIKKFKSEILMYLKDEEKEKSYIYSLTNRIAAVFSISFGLIFIVALILDRPRDFSIFFIVFYNFISIYNINLMYYNNIILERGVLVGYKIIEWKEIVSYKIKGSKNRRDLFDLQLKVNKKLIPQFILVPNRKKEKLVELLEEKISHTLSK